MSLLISEKARQPLDVGWGRTDLRRINVRFGYHQVLRMAF